MLARCTKKTQMESTWCLCRSQGAKGSVCEFVGNITDYLVTENIQKSTRCNDTVIRESLTGPSKAVISNVDNFRRRLLRAKEEIGLLNIQDIDRVEDGR